jgi:thiamine biosynthesis lipoprotein
MKKYRYAAPLAVMLALVVITIVRSRSAAEAPATRSALVMDTLAEVTVWGRGEAASAAVDSAMAALSRVDSLLGYARLDSRSDHDLIAGPDVARILDVARRVHTLTGGLFDPTIGSVTRLWTFGEDGAVPDPDSLGEGLRHVGFSRFLAAPDSAGFTLDLGGIAKGYAVDLAAASLARLGVRSAIVSAGGDMRLVGRRSDGKPWRIAIRHPRLAGAFVGYLKLAESAVATSGDYERCFIAGGRRYHHILSPRDGMPASATTSVTVVAPSSALADALATGLFVMGPHRGLELAESLEGVGAVFVWAEGESLAVTRNLEARFERARLD